jgi:hypothetical protein
VQQLDEAIAGRRKHDVDVRLAEARPMIDDRLAARQLAAPLDCDVDVLERRCNVRQRAERHERHPARARADLADQHLDGVRARGPAPAETESDVPHSVPAVYVVPQVLRAAPRPGRAGVDRDVGAGELAHVERVLHRLVERHVPCDDGDRPDVGLRMA